MTQRKEDHTVTTARLFDDLIGHYCAISEELIAKAKQAGLLGNPTDVGTLREEIYRGFLERYLPKTCDVFLGGFLFSLNGERSAQIDVIVSSNNALAFQISPHSRNLSLVEGSIAAIEIKSCLDKKSLIEALDKCASIPSILDRKDIVSPNVNLSDEHWCDTPYKIVFAYSGINELTLLNHLKSYYNRRGEIPVHRRPNIIHVLGKYVLLRKTSDLKVLDSDCQLRTGQYMGEFSNSDSLGLSWILFKLTERAFLANHLFFKYGRLHDKIADRLLSL